MGEVTLRELCEREGVSRRAVQGYEALGLVRSSGKNKMGYLLYDEDAERRVHQIRRLQEVGFSLKTIKAVIDAPNQVMLEALQNRAAALEREYEQVDEKLHTIEQMIRELS